MSKASEVEQQFERQFACTDWKLFKHMADANLSEAAQLKKKDMRRSAVSSLLARNVRKRLLIGIGVELLLKAAFLKAGYAINLRRSKPAFPIRFDEIGNEALLSKTATLDSCIKHLATAVPLKDEEQTREGLTIAKVFRNKEAHSVLEVHTFDPETYRSIELSLIAVYRDAFGEDLKVTIAMAKEDEAVWKVRGYTQ